MAEYRVWMATDKLPERTGDRDAYKIRLVVERADGTYFQYVTPVVSGVQLSSKEASEIPRAELWSAVAVEALPLIADAAQQGEIPLADPKQAFEVFPVLRDAVRRARDDPKVFAESELVGEI